MAIELPAYLKVFSVLTVIFAILYTYEVPLDPKSPDRKTFLFTKIATVQHDRMHVFNFLTNIDKYAAWYPNVGRVEHIQLIPSNINNHEGEKYRLITRIPLLGETSSFLIIHIEDRPKQLVYSVDTWLHEVNSIELKDNPTSVNSTIIEWTVYTERRSVLFQYLLLPFASFYKNQIVREALFSLIMQIRDL